MFSELNLITPIVSNKLIYTLNIPIRGMGRAVLLLRKLSPQEIYGVFAHGESPYAALRISFIVDRTIWPIEKVTKFLNNNNIKYMTLKFDIYTPPVIMRPS